MKTNSIIAYNMQTTSGNSVKDQIVVKTNSQVSFISHGQLITTIDYDNKVIYLNPIYWDYSTTTSKYRNKFFKDQLFYEIDTTQKLSLQKQVSSVFIGDTLYTIRDLEF